MQFKPRHVVAIVASLCAVVVLAPIGVMAATGQLVNIIDPVNGRQARVGDAGTLQVESRAGVPPNSFSRLLTRTTLGTSVVANATSPSRVALTQLAVSTTGSSYPEWEVVVYGYVQTTSTASCGTTTTGYTRTELARIVVPAQDTRQILWNGPPLIAPGAAAGKKSCVALTLWEMGSGGTVHMNATGYTFS